MTAAGEHGRRDQRRLARERDPAALDRDEREERGSARSSRAACVTRAESRARSSGLAYARPARQFRPAAGRRFARRGRPCGCVFGSVAPADESRSPQRERRRASSGSRSSPTRSGGSRASPSRSSAGPGRRPDSPTQRTRRRAPSSSTTRGTAPTESSRSRRPPTRELERLRAGQLLIGFLQPLTDRERIDRLRERGVLAFAMESIPRTTRAQAMDALSSQATVSGYKAVLIGADQLPRFLPMLTTAAGTIAPARALVLGAGVAGLQAIATARRLGAVVSGFDVRPAVREQVQSLGRDVPRPRRHRRGDRRRLRPRADARGAGAAAGGACRADPGFRPRDHDRGDSRPAGPAADPGLGGREDAAGLGDRRPGRRERRQLRARRSPARSSTSAASRCRAAQPPEHRCRGTRASSTHGTSRALLEHLAPGGELTLDWDDEITAGACVTRKEQTP